MNELLVSPPKTIMEVYKMLPEGTLAELINKIIYMSPSPVRKHQQTVGKVFNQLYRFSEATGACEVYIAPFDVYLDEHSNAVQPDIILVLKQNLKIVQEHIHGVPDLVVEILSEGNKEHDLRRKRDLYERFGVQEYWVIDPDSREAVVLQLQDFKYVEFFKGRSLVKSALLETEIQF